MAHLIINEKVNTSGKPLKYGSQLVVEKEKLEVYEINMNSLYIKHLQKDKTNDEFINRIKNSQEDRKARLHVEETLDVTTPVFKSMKKFAEQCDAIVSFKEGPKKSNSISF